MRFLPPPPQQLHRLSSLLLAVLWLLPGSGLHAASNPTLPEGTRVLRDLAYVDNGHARQKLDLYLPHGSEKRPLLIWIHGGAWMSGDKERPPALAFLQHGFAVASLNYRLSQHALFPAQIQDCRAAVRWLRAHAAEYNLDPDRLGAWGASAGGHLVTLLGTASEVRAFDVGDHLDQSSSVQCVVDFFGPTDFLLMNAQRLPGTMDHDGPDSPESRLIGGAIQEHPDAARQASPLTAIRGDEPPFLIVHGDQDPLVPHAQSLLLRDALLKAGGTVELYTVKGGGHGGFRDPQVQPKVEAFLSQHLKP